MHYFNRSLIVVVSILLFATGSFAFASERRVIGTPTETTLAGTLDVLHEDHKDTSLLRYILTTKNNERFELNLPERSPTLHSGMQISARGLLHKDVLSARSGTAGNLHVRKSDGILLDPVSALEADASMLAADFSGSLGERSVLAILVNFQDKPIEQPWTLNEVHTMIFTRVNSYFQEVSSGQTSLSGEVTGWYTLPINSTVCDSLGVKSLADARAKADGYDPVTYQHVVYIFPKNVCGYSGMSSTGSSAGPDFAWVNGALTLRTIGHELGHNFGLSHAHALDCGTSTLGTSTCVTQEYGDTLDIMGYSGTVGHVGGFGKEYIGWLPSSNIVTVTEGGTFTILPGETITSLPKLLKIQNGTDLNGAANYYYVEYRQPIGFDAQLTDRGVIDPNNIFNGVIIRKGSPSSGGSSYLLDMTPGSNFVDMKDAALTAGRSFSDPTTNVTISVLSTSTTGATVSVSFTPSCVRANPSITLTPSSQWGSAGQALNYSVVVTNNDSASCPSSTFTVIPTLPLGFVQSPPSLSTTLLPGAFSTQSVAIISPGNATPGSYSFSEKVTNNALAAYSAIISGNYGVNVPVVDTTLPVTAITSPSNGAILSKRSAVTLSASASDNVGVTRVEFWVNNKLFCMDNSSSYSCTWSVPGGKSTTHSIQSKAYDAAGNIGFSPVVTVTSR